MFTTGIDVKNSMMSLGHFQIFSSPDLYLKFKFKLVLNIIGIANNTSPQKHFVKVVHQSNKTSRQHTPRTFHKSTCFTQQNSV